jgi:DivIVA domain-containing protein
MAEESSSRRETEQAAPAAGDGGQEQGFANLQHYVPQDLLDVSFPVAVRGYDRRAVEAYVKRVNRVIAELKVRSSPPAAVRHALEEAEAKVQGLLQAAHEAAEQITASAQQEAEENTSHAKAEAATLLVDTSAEADRMKAESAELVANAKREAENIVSTAQSDADEQRASAKAEAENIVARAQAEADQRLSRLEEELRSRQEEGDARMHRLQSDTEAVWNERRDLLEDVRRMSDSLVELANAAATRIRHEGVAEPEPEPEDEPTRVIEPQESSEQPGVKPQP